MVDEALKPATKCLRLRALWASNPSAALEAESGAAFLPPAAGPPQKLSNRPKT